MSDTADRYATREEIEDIYQGCWDWVLELSAITYDLEQLPYPWAIDRHLEHEYDYDIELGRSGIDAMMEPVLARRLQGDFYPFPDSLTDEDRTRYAAHLGTLLERLSTIRSAAELALHTLEKNLLYAESTVPEFSFLLGPFRWTFDVFILPGVRLRGWILTAIEYLETGKAELRQKLTSTPIPFSSDDVEALLPRLRIEQSVLLRDWATLAPLVPSLGVVTRSPGAIEAPSSPPAIAAAADAPSADPAADEETKADQQNWGPWSRYIAKQDIENELNSGCLKTLKRNAGKNGFSYDLEMHPENSKLARFRRRLSPPS